MKFSAVFLFSLFISAGSWSQSIITFERIFVKIDTMAQNSSTVHKIKFLNTGNKPLQITGCTPENPGDNCTFDKKALAPGTAGYLTYRPESSQCGKYARNLTVTTKDGETVVLHLKGVIRCSPDKPKEEQ